MKDRGRQEAAAPADSRLSPRPLERTFGAVIPNLSLASIRDAAFSELYEAWLEYALLIFPDQHLDAAQQVAFASRFGTLVPGLEAVELSNVLPDGKLRQAPDDDMMKIIRGNMHWHQDNTYMPLQAKGAVFSAQVVPAAGGDTAFVDMRAAWDALDEATRKQLEQLSAYHSLAHSQKVLGEETKTKNSEYIGYGLDVPDAPLRPLLKRHPETGRPSLAVGRHAFGVPGMEEAASARFLSDLVDFAASDPVRVYQHRWTPGDVVVWDNRCLMHRARPWDYDEPRVMRHSRIAGDPSSELAVAS